MAPSIGVNLRVTGHCNQGGRKYMEDAFAVAYQQTKDETDLEYAYFGIFDGHGGREAALFAKEHLMDFIVSQKNFWSDNDNLVLKAIRDGFMTTHMAMWKEVGKWPQTISGLPSTSGSTASVIFIRKGKMYIGHVGDSAIILGYREPGKSNFAAQPLTRDHKPESPSERRRIENVGGSVMSKSGVQRVVWNRPRLGHQGPIRRSTRIDQIPFLAVARSLGDLWSYDYFHGEFIVSPEPDVNVITIDPKRDRCLILATDGLWNMISPTEAAQIVEEAEHENEKNILEDMSGGESKPWINPSKLLVDRALEHWFRRKMRADNTSVVTVMLDPPGPPRSEVLRRQHMLKKLRPREDPDNAVISGNQDVERRESRILVTSTLPIGNDATSEREKPSADSVRLNSMSKFPQHKSWSKSNDIKNTHVKVVHQASPFNSHCKLQQSSGYDQNDSWKSRHQSCLSNSELVPKENIGCSHKHFNSTENESFAQKNIHNNEVSRLNPHFSNQSCTPSNHFLPKSERRKPSHGCDIPQCDLKPVEKKSASLVSENTIQQVKVLENKTVIKPKGSHDNKSNNDFVHLKQTPKLTCQNSIIDNRSEIDQISNKLTVSVTRTFKTSRHCDIENKNNRANNHSPNNEDKSFFNKRCEDATESSDMKKIDDKCCNPTKKRRHSKKDFPSVALEERNGIVGNQGCDISSYSKETSDNWNLKQEDLLQHKSSIRDSVTESRNLQIHGMLVGIKRKQSMPNSVDVSTNKPKLHCRSQSWTQNCRSLRLLRHITRSKLRHRKRLE